MKIEATVYDLQKDLTMHITGNWNSVDEMEEQLKDDGMVLLWHTILQ